MEGRGWDAHLLELLLGVRLDREGQLDLACLLVSVWTVRLNLQRVRLLLDFSIGQRDLLCLTRLSRLLAFEGLIVDNSRLITRVEAV